MTTPDIVTQVMAALIAALIVALAEVYFLAKIIWSEIALSIHRDTLYSSFMLFKRYLCNLYCIKCIPDMNERRAHVSKNMTASV